MSGGQTMRIMAMAGVLVLACSGAQAQSVDPAPGGGCVPLDPPPAAGAPAGNVPSDCIAPVPEPVEDPAQDPMDAAANAARERYMAGEYEAGFKEAFPLARAGNRIAQNMIGNAYYFGYGVVQDCRLGEKWTKSAADQGLDRAQFNYARMKFTGCYGDGIDADLSLDYYQRAVAAEFAPAYAGLARLLASGAAGAPDPVQIRALLDRGIAAGMDNAALALADLQASGEGLPRDQAAAVAWYRAEAPKGPNPEAMRRLAQEYLKGIGDAEPDRVAAYALVDELMGLKQTRAAPDYAKLLIETPDDYWHDPINGWAHCVVARNVVGPENFGEVDAACEALRPLVATGDLMKAALVAARMQ